MKIEPENLRRNELNTNDIRQIPSPVNKTVNPVKIDDETKIVHIDRKSQNECAVITTVGNRSQKA